MMSASWQLRSLVACDAWKQGGRFCIATAPLVVYFRLSNNNNALKQLIAPYPGKFNRHRLRKMHKLHLKKILYSHALPLSTQPLFYNDLDYFSPWTRAPGFIIDIIYI